MHHAGHKLILRRDFLGKIWQVDFLKKKKDRFRKTTVFSIA